MLAPILIPRVCFPLWAAGLLGVAAGQGGEASIALPLPVDQSRSTTTRHLQKPVLASRLLDGMESTTNWSLFGPGEMTLTGERARDGIRALRLTSPTKTEQPPPVQGRPFGETGVRRSFADEDWSEFNRISFWVYPTLPGFNVVSLLVKLQSEGTAGQRYTHGGLHYVLLRNHEWNRVVWEFAHLERRQVKGVEFVYRLQGHEPGATKHVCFDFDQLELQRVEPDTYLGWPVAAGRVAYNHTGYQPASVKQAISSASAATFQVLDAEGRLAHEGPTRLTSTPLGEFRLLDFSGLVQPGVYRLKAGDLITPPFPVQEDPWTETILATINHFHCQRCGYGVPGIHGVCHRDWQVKHGDRRLPINGGWHDAGDLSQGLVNTSEAAWSMLRLADRLQETHRSSSTEAGRAGLRLADRLLEEARWGVEWLLNTRFGDGHRVTWATMDFWTDGELGTSDDVVVESRDAPFDNSLAAAAEALAARLFAARDSGFAARCRQAAEEDWRFAMDKLGRPGVEVASAAVQASLELHRTTERSEFAERAVALAKVLLESQEQQPQPWSLPLSGFFYTAPNRERVLHYSHRSHEQAPVVALADLCDALPSHPDRAGWLAGVKRYGDYLRATAAVTAPYHMIPAGIWRADQGPEWERAQARRGMKLDDRHYLRRFPCWPDFRGNLGVQLSQGVAAARAARLLGETALLDLARAQLEWALGRNPFGQSLMYGVGHDYAPQYTAMSGDIAGSLPVGIQTRLDDDEPYWPTANCYNYAEVWVHPSSRWLGIMAELIATPK
jgi:hypothetical protein